MSSFVKCHINFASLGRSTILDIAQSFLLFYYKVKNKNQLKTKNSQYESDKMKTNTRNM